MTLAEKEINGLTYALVEEDKNKVVLREFFKKHYPDVALDVFPATELNEFFNPVVFNAKNEKGHIVGGILSCAPPILAEQAQINPTHANKNRVERLTFVDMLAFDEEYVSHAPDGLDYFVEVAREKGIKVIIGFVVRASSVARALDKKDFTILNPYDSLPNFQGYAWQLPPTADAEQIVWFYKMI
jgi:hypothetical protein